MKYSYLECYVILFVLFLTGCSSQDKDLAFEEQDSTTSSSDNQVVTHVNAINAEISPLAYELSTRGIILPAKLHHLSFESQGALRQLRVRNGDHVRSGILIAELENRNQELAVAEAKLNYQDAWYKDEDERMFLNDSSFYKDKWNQVDEKTALKSGLPQAKVALDRAQAELEQTKLYAPFSGIISDLKVTTGSFLKANQPVCMLYDPNQLEIRVKLLEYDYPKIKLGQHAAVTVLANPGQTVAGTITEINPKVDESGHFEVKVGLTSAEGLVPGMNASVTIRVMSSEAQLVVPLAAVVHRSERDVVFTFEDGQAKWNYVTLGRQNGEWVEVLEGLSEGNRVITTNAFQLAHDSPVIIDSISQKTSAGL